MMKIKNLTPEFVEYIPEKVEEGTLYISERYRTAVHKCCCGCGREVVTPLTPADWQARRDGNRVSLWPSIGNWSFPCRSHYVIRQNRVLVAGDMTDRQVQQVKARDRADKEKWIARTNRNKGGKTGNGESTPGNAAQGIGLLDRFMQWWRNL
jgi:hypothetical protein